MKLRTKAILFFGSLLLFVVLVDVFYVQYGVRNTFINQTTNNFRIIAEQTESTFLVFSESMKTRVVNWGSDVMVDNLAKAVLDTKIGTPEHDRVVKEFADYVREYKMPLDKTVFLVDLLDKDGVVIASTQADRIGASEGKVKSSHRALQFSKAISSRVREAFVNSVVFEPEIISEPVTQVSVRIFVSNKNGELQPTDSVLLVHFANTQHLVAVLNGEIETQVGRPTSKALLEGYKTSEIYFVNSDHRAVVPSRYGSGIAMPQSVNTLPVSECLDEGREINQEYDNPHGVRVLGASMCLEDRGIVLILETQKDEIFAPLNTLTKGMSAWVLVLFVLGVLVAIFVVRWPLVHIDEIVKALERVMKGDFSATVKVGTKDEIGRLASMFNMMIESIRKSQKELRESKQQTEEKAALLEKDLKEHEKQEKFLEESKRATLNLLEDSWKAKEKLEEEGSKLQTILASIGDGLILIDPEYKIVLVNKKAVEIFEMSQENLMGKDLREVVKLYKNKEYIKPEVWPTEEVFLTKKSITTTVDENFGITTKGREQQLPVAFSFAPLSGRFSGVVMVFRDVTEDRELDEAKSGFISVASHQLRTPLTSIRWYSEMLLSEDSGPLNEAQKDFMREIHGGAERLYKTVDLLLGISRIESGKVKTDKVQIDLGIFTGEIVRELSSQINEKNLTLTISPKSETPVVVWLDSIVLRQVILNILSNAIRYTNENGAINISWRFFDDKNGVVYEVRDNGIGIPEAQRSRIFSKFFRAENARAQVPDGSGLGLSLVKDLVESWKGKVWFESKENEGATFFFTIPFIPRTGSSETNYVESK